MTTPAIFSEKERLVHLSASASLWWNKFSALSPCLRSKGQEEGATRKSQIGPARDKRIGGRNRTSS